MPILKLSKNERRRASVFFTCLILSFVAWVLTMLSNTYVYKVRAVVNFTSAPVKRSFRSLQSDTVDAEIQGNGWNMLFSRMNMDNKNIAVNLKSLDNKNFVVLSAQIKNINFKREPNMQIIGFTPDTLYFDFSSRDVKKVPVQLQYNLSFKHQFAIANNIAIKPDYVTVTGPAAVIAKINVWKTDSLSLSNVEDPVERNLGLQPVKESNMSIYPKIVNVKIPVEEYTEKTLEIPVKLINNKNYYNVKVFPQKVKVTFTIPLSRYSETDELFFEAVADLDMWRQHGYKELPVKLTRFPDFCKLVSIAPQNVDFIVKQ